MTREERTALTYLDGSVARHSYTKEPMPMRPHDEWDLPDAPVTHREVKSVVCGHCGAGYGAGCAATSGYPTRAHRVRVQDAGRLKTDGRLVVITNANPLAYPRPESGDCSACGTGLAPWAHPAGATCQECS